MRKCGTRRLLAWIMAVFMVMSGLPFDNLHAKAVGDEATVYCIWGQLKPLPDGGDEPDPETLVIADECPQGLVPIAKYITNGTYVPKLSVEDHEDADIALLLNNATVDLRGTGEDRIKDFWPWVMSGNSAVLFDNMTASTSDGDVSELDNIPAYQGEINAVDLFNFYAAYPFNSYTDGSGKEILPKEPRYDVTGNHEVNGPLRAGRLVVNEGANLVLNAIENGEEPTKGGQVEAMQMEINGTVTLAPCEEDDAPPQIRVYEGGSLTLGANGAINACDGTELILHADATVSDSLKTQLFERDGAQDGALVAHALADNHSLEKFTYDAAEGKWIYVQGSVCVDYDEWLDEHNDPRASVSVNGTSLRNGETLEFEAGQPLTFSFVMPEERNGCEPVIDFWCEDGYYCTWTDDPNYKITVENNSFTFTPSSNYKFTVFFGWSEYDRVWPNPENNEIVLETRGNGGSVEANVTALRTVNEPNDLGGVKKLVKVDEIENDCITFTFTPEEGASLRDVAVWLQDQEEKYTVRNDFDPNEGWKAINEENGFTENDGVYVYTFNNISQYDGEWIGVEAWFDHGNFEEIGNNQYQLRYEYFGGSEEDPDGKVFINEASNWVFAARDEIRDFTEGEALTFKMVLPERREGSTPIVEIWTNKGEYYSSFDETDAEHKIEINADNTFTFIPATKDGFEIKIHWSYFDYCWFEEGDFLIITESTDNGTVSMNGKASYEEMDEPGEAYNGVKHWYHNADLDEEPGVFVVATPDEHYHIASVRIDLDYLDGREGIHFNFVNRTPNGEDEICLFADGNPFVLENGSLICQVPALAKDSFIHMAVEFGYDTDVISLNTHGAQVEYRFSEQDDFAPFPGIAMGREAFEGKNQIQLKFTQGNEEIRGLKVVTREDGSEDQHQMLPLNADGILTLQKDGLVWKSYEIEVITWDELLDGQYRFENCSNDNEIVISDGNKQFDEAYDMPENQMITFTLNKDAFKVLACPNGQEEEELSKVDGQYQYQLKSDAALTIRIFLTEEDFIEYGKPKFRVEYDECMDYETHTAGASVSEATKGALANAQDCSYDVNDQLVFTLTPPENRNGCTPVVEIEMRNGEVFSTMTEDAAHKIVISDNQFTFPVADGSGLDDRGFVIRIWWSEYDQMRPSWEENEFVIETRGVDGAVTADVTAEKTVDEPNGSGVRKLVKLDKLTNDSIQFTLTPNEGRKLRDLSVRIGDREVNYTNKKDESPEEWIAIEGNEAFTEADGVYTFTISNVSQLSENWISINAMFENAEDNNELHDPELMITGKNLTLLDAIAIGYRIPETALANYHDPYLVVTQNGRTKQVRNYTISNGYYIFTFGVAPQMIGDKVTAVPHALDGEERDVIGEPFEYSVSEYCYNMLGKEAYQTDEWASFRRLLVDILLYGDSAQLYQNYEVDTLAGAQLTTEQRAMGTDVTAEMTYNTVKDKEFETVSAEDELAFLERTAIYLGGGVSLQFMFKADDVTDLRVVVAGNPDGTDLLGEYVPGDKDANDYYTISVARLNASQMRKTVYATVMKGDKKVSNTYRYSIESYVANIKGKYGDKLDNLLDAMMRYGDSAANYVQGR